MADDLHCPQCKARITPYEHESNDKMTKGNVIPACWNCGLPMETVLRLNEQGIRELGAPRVTLSQAEQEIADLRAEIERLKSVGAPPPPVPQDLPPPSTQVDPEGSREREGWHGPPDNSPQTQPPPSDQVRLPANPQPATSQEYGEEDLAKPLAAPPIREQEAASPPPAINWKDRTPPPAHRGPGRPKAGK